MGKWAKQKTDGYMLLTNEKADALASRLSANAVEDGDNWTYKAKHDPTGNGYSFIEVYDEVGEYLGRL